MKKITVISITILFLSTVISFGQEFKVQLPPGYNIIMNSDDLTGKEGSQYLAEQFLPGTIKLYNGKMIHDLTYRYNVYKYEMQYKLGDKIYIIGTPDSLQNIVIADKKFIYTAFATGNRTGKTYFEISVDGSVKLLIRYYIMVTKANYDVVHDIGNKMDQLELKESYFILKDNHTFEIDKKGKSIFGLFPNNQKEISDFMKSNKLSFGKITDLIPLVNFCNTLQ